MFHAPKFILFLLLLVILVGCEYDGIQSSSDCNLNPLSLTIIEVNNTPCGLDEGQITAAVENAQGEYEYSIGGGVFSQSPVFSNLSAGTYTVTARNTESLCESEPQVVEILNIDGLQITVDKTDTNCGSSSGIITISQENGVAPIEYRLNNGAFQPDPTFSGLSSGNYTITAKDAVGCETSKENINITSGTSLTDHVQPIIMANCAVSGCHNGNQSPNLSTKEGIINNASRIKTRTANGTMPPAGRQNLTQEQIDLIICWVDEGALNN